MTINLTDPANHPANGPLTAERIKRVRDELQRTMFYASGGVMDYIVADAIKGLEELLVEKEAASKPVPDEELDQMIWKLERDGMTPKLLSLMRELREVRRNSPATPDGYVLVPVEPTDEMLHALYHCGTRLIRPFERQLYQDMLAAATNQEVK